MLFYNFEHSFKHVLINNVSFGIYNIDITIYIGWALSLCCSNERNVIIQKNIGINISQNKSENKCMQL